jgi:hypothetical protein
LEDEALYFKNVAIVYVFPVPGGPHKSNTSPFPIPFALFKNSGKEKRRYIEGCGLSEIYEDVA